MKPALLFAFLFILQISAAAQSKINGSNFALVIGISQYEDKQIPALQYADKDATIFASYLQQRLTNKVSDNRLRLLTNEKATISAIYEALDWLKENCGKDDTAYIYFSGHGDLEVQTEFSIGYLLAYNSPPNNYRNNAIKLEDVNQVANTLTVKNQANVILITDACHSGKLAGDFQKGKQLVGSQLRLVLNNEVRLTACGPNELAAEGVNWGGGRGVFSYYLMQGLSGAADKTKDGTVKLDELTSYIENAFATDKFLIREQLKQKPVIDGHPYFPLPTAPFDTTVSITRTDGLENFTALAIQPLDYFFAYAKRKPLESMIRFEEYTNGQVAELPLRMVTDLLRYTENQVPTEDQFAYPAPDSLRQLQNQLKNPQVVSRFNERFIQLVHEKGQDMINAYLGGDLAELERRQYYYQGNRNYAEFRNMQAIAMKMTSPNHYLARLLDVQFRYIKGLTNRLRMAESKATDSLVTDALHSQREALAIEPYAAYIHNEIGNLLLNKERIDSADYHFTMATTLAPTWSIPWSNKIRLNLAKGNFSIAAEAFQKADSLQPGLAFNLMNAGLVLEKQKNWLGAETYYRKAIKKNNVHFFPFERLSNIYLITGDLAQADFEIFQTRKRKKDFALNDNSFRFGLELAGRVVPDSSSAGESLAKRYLLAKAYEDKQQFDSAIQQYLRIAAIEDQLQYDQAVYKGFQMPKGEGEEQMINGQKIFDSFEDPLPLTGVIKAAQLYERLGRYREAEKLLLDQVRKNQRAGDARQNAIDKKMPGTWQMQMWGGIPYNYYWLAINAPLEGETFNFYWRTIKKFPRDGEWKEKAAIFLYKRLAMSFDRLPVEEYEGFHRYIQGKAYPFATDGSPMRKGIIYVLPGTNEVLYIDMLKYDPLELALHWMDEAIKLSGELTPRKEILKIWADLNAWYGNTDRAIDISKQWLKSTPGDKTKRTRIIELMVFNYDLTEAFAQLDTLHMQKQANTEQQLRFADYLILSDKPDRAEKILRNMRLTDISNKENRFFLLAKLNWLKGNFVKALPYLTDSMKVWKKAEQASDQADEYGLFQAATIPYLVARMYAMMNDENKALAMLSRSRKNGFIYGNVLENDEALKKIRQTAAWKQLNDTYPYGVDYDEGGEDVSYKTLEYIIPNFKPVDHR